MQFETERLLLRPMDPDDFDAVAQSLKDPRVMYAWEHGFSDQEVRRWIHRRMEGYARCGHDYFLALDRTDGAPVGQIGLLNMKMDGKPCLGVGWILNRDRWHRGYATEGGAAMLDYAFDTLKADVVQADIRPENRASVRVARRLGMREAGQFVKLVSEKDMLHLIFAIRREDWRGLPHRDKE